MPSSQIEHLDLFLMKSYPDFSLNAQIEHRNFDISFLGFKIFKRFKIEPILSDLAQKSPDRKTTGGLLLGWFKTFFDRKKSFFEVRP